MNQTILNEIEEIYPRLYRLVLPTPFHVGPVNVYLITGKIPTLVDTGPLWPQSWEALQAALQKLNFSLKNLRQIVLTHGHVDHSGQARKIQQNTGAEVLLHRGDAFRLQQPFTSYGAKDLQYIEELYNPGGVPPAITEVVKKVYAAYYTQFMEPLAQVSFLEDGQQVFADPYTLTVIHCPGHSPGMINLWEKDKKFLLSGDHLLKDITPNPVLEVPNNSQPRFKSLVNYMKSLEKVRALKVLRALPAHGDLIEDMDGLLDYLFNHHRIRRTLVKGFLRHGPKTVYQLCLDLFGELPPQQMYLEVSEVLGHLDVIEEEGLLVFSKKEGRVYYQIENRQ